MFDQFFGQCPTVKCKCGNTMQFPNGYYPEYFTCQNCGAAYTLHENVKVEYPNENLNLSMKEMMEEIKKNKNKQKVKESLKVIK